MKGKKKGERGEDARTVLSQPFFLTNSLLFIYLKKRKKKEEKEKGGRMRK